MEAVPSAELPRLPGTRRLKPKSHIPLYIQLTEILKERIEAGEWAPGQRFASEGELGNEFGVSRTVVRPALAILENDGQLVKLKGRGIYVAPAKEVHRIDGLIRNLATADPRHVQNRIIDATEDHADDRLARTLAIAAGHADVAHIMSVVEANGRAIAIRDSFISPHVARAVLDHIGGPQLNAAPLSLPPAMSLEHAEVEIETTSASPFEAEQLNIGAGSPTMLSTYRDFARVPPHGLVPVEFARMVYRTDIISFHFVLR